MQLKDVEKEVKPVVNLADWLIEKLRNALLTGFDEKQPLTLTLLITTTAYMLNPNLNWNLINLHVCCHIHTYQMFDINTGKQNVIEQAYGLQG